ncbi:MAG: hypothetical protein MUO63_17355 [Desulfobulbaceae bacterium]|nr:hypothetical protein [Desulfobulbaceae bacterium]
MVHEQQIEHIAQEIERYLQTRPNAADSLEGITKWWLTRQRYEVKGIKIEYEIENIRR